MPRYEFQCADCNRCVDFIVLIAERNNIKRCRMCGGLLVRQMSIPAITYGDIDNYPDHYWDNAEKVKQSGLSKRGIRDRTKLADGDKEIVQKEENKINNMRRSGNDVVANMLEKKLETKGKT